ncbi:hypothetical protein F511_32836 [Dorcoceras hygrometricum]|uniref:Uncharacterized protein n=1 Tax=Dorcoceras hygrometricum TaxID=472368 RepID=A0A2Z7AZ65_9LAMI|nr:hypothetical protein F511_32836 [Dorcoceras hygrometricum]
MSSIKNPLAAILDCNKFTGLNYEDWLRNLQIVFASEKLLYTLDKTPPKKVPLEEFDPQTQSPSLAPGELLYSTPALGCVNHLFYAYVRKATDTEFNAFVLGRDLIVWV